MTASVVSGSISETAPTMVVLPTPKPPAITIFAEVISLGCAPARSELAKSTQYPFQQIHPLREALLGSGAVQRQQSVGAHVRDSTRATPSGCRVNAESSARDCGLASQSTAMRYLS